MNLVFLGIIIFIILVLMYCLGLQKPILQKISKNIRLIIVVFSIILGAALILVIAGSSFASCPNTFLTFTFD